MMTYDLEILKDLFLPLLEDMASHSQAWADDMQRSDNFWDKFNNALLNGPTELRQLLTSYKITDIELYKERIANLKAEYISLLAQYYCTGHTSPAITWLIAKADAAFMEEVAFQKHMQTAIVQAGRAAIKEELKLAEEFEYADISDEEVTTAFSALQRDAARDELRKQLQQQDDVQPAMPKPERRKRIGAIPLFFLRFAAAAAVGAVATVGVVKVYNSRDREVPTAKHNTDTGANKAPGYQPVSDTAGKADTLHPSIATRTPGKDSGKTNTKDLYIILKGSAVDTANSELLTDVSIIMTDDKGKEKTEFSKDGKFRLKLPLHRDFVITGKKEGYHSAKLSLSTKDAVAADAGTEIEVVLRFSKDP